MKSCKNRNGITLIEILIVLAIIAILAMLVINIASRIDTQGKQRLTKNTFALIDAALCEFRDYGYEYDAGYANADLRFPLDCNGFSMFQLTAELEDALGLNPGDITITGDANDPNYSGGEVLYFFLNWVPESREVLDKIDKSLKTGKDNNKQDITVNVNGKLYPFLRLIDPWGKTLRYSYYDNGNESPTSEPGAGSPRIFPIITSAGPDNKFGSVDDITSR